MQPIITPVRAHLTEAQVVWLIRDAPGLEFAAGCELVDTNLTVLADLSDVLQDGVVERQSYADLHGTATLTLERALDWGQALVRPYMVVSASGIEARFNLGAYYTSAPKGTLGADPEIFEVTGYDILDVLNTPVGESYAVAKDEGYLFAVEQILINEGVTQYLIDQSRADATLPSPRVWPMDENTTWLSIVNDLIGAVGYAGIWSDWDGRLRVQPYRSPSSRPAEWLYDLDIATTMLGPDRPYERDLYRSPNRWVFYRANNIDGPAPVEGNGVFTYVNTSAGPTSVLARGGRVFTKPVPLDVADQAALVDAGRRVVDADLRNPVKVTPSTSPNPLHWHFDRVALLDPAMGPFNQMLATSWKLPLNGDDMPQEWSQLYPDDLRVGPQTGEGGYPDALG